MSRSAWSIIERNRAKVIAPIAPTRPAPAPIDDDRTEHAYLMRSLTLLIHAAPQVDDQTQREIHALLTQFEVTQTICQHGTDTASSPPPGVDAHPNASAPGPRCARLPSIA